jgi:hypothetical protein
MQKIVQTPKSWSAVFRAGFLGAIALAALGGLASGQSSVPLPHGMLPAPNDLASGQSSASSSHGIFPTPDDLNRRHRGPTGKPCLALEGYAKAEAINPRIFEHWVGVTNSCGQQIKVQVCYDKTQDCIAMSVPPYERKDSVLGIFPALADFRYDAKEQF